MNRRFFHLLLALSLLCSAAARGANEWQPAKTYALVASICNWPEKAGLAAFTGTRRDADFVEQLKAAGVPAANVIFLKDSAATHAGMRKSLRDLAARCGPEDTLIFTFQGHGGRKVLYCYDYDAARSDETVFQMDEILPILETGWKGNRLFLIGDCCCSGSLRSVLGQFAKKRPETRVAVLASATASNTSTGNWTFTEGLIRAFKGDALLDRDHDGRIAISELGSFLHDQMKYKEDQLASLTFSANFEKDFVLRGVAPGAKRREVPGPHQIGDVIEARDTEGKWYPSEIIDWRQGGTPYRVHYVGWDDKWDEWVDAGRLRAIVKPKLNVGEHYEVKWKGKWYPATITHSVEDYFYFAHYAGEAGEDDEWITPERARVPRKKTGKQEPEYVALDLRPPAVGEQVAAQYHGEWYRARVTGNVNGTFVVRYTDKSEGRLAAGEIIPIVDANQLKVGDRVLALWTEDEMMYPGKVQAILPQKAVIRWEDGSGPSKVALQDLARIKR